MKIRAEINEMEKLKTIEKLTKLIVVSLKR